MHMTQLTSPKAVIDALGGIRPTAELVGVKYNAVDMWRANARIPAKYSAVINAELAKRREAAALSVFGIIEPEAAQ